MHIYIDTTVKNGRQLFPFILFICSSNMLLSMCPKIEAILSAAFKWFLQKYKYQISFYAKSFLSIPIFNKLFLHCQIYVGNSVRFKRGDRHMVFDKVTFLLLKITRFIFS